MIDDGRRWLVRNHDLKLDLIVANSTLNWRSNASNLLSVEFLELVRSRLNPGGIYFYNTTESLRVIRTGCTVFPHALMIGSFIAVSDAPLRLDLDRVPELLFNYPHEGGTALNRSNPRHLKALDRQVGWLRRFTRTRSVILKLTPSRPLVTDDNMGTEWEVEPETIE